MCGSSIPKATISRSGLLAQYQLEHLIFHRYELELQREPPYWTRAQSHWTRANSPTYNLARRRAASTTKRIAPTTTCGSSS